MQNDVKLTQPGLHAPQTAQSVKGILIRIIAALCACAVIAAVIVGVKGLNQPPAPGRKRVLRDVIFLNDFTGSMSLEEQQEEKKIEVAILRSSIGPSDRVAAFRIMPDFSEARDCIYGDKQPPEASENLQDPIHNRHAPPEVAERLWRETQEVIEKDWIPKLEAQSMPVDAQGQPLQGSGYLDALAFVAERFKQRADGRKLYLIVIGDLCQQPFPLDSTSTSADNGQQEAFRDVEILLVYPFRSHQNSEFKSEKLLTYWREYFARHGKDPEEINFITFNAGLANPLLPANPTIHPSAHP